MLALFASHNAQASFDLSLDGMNTKSKACYEQTLRVAKRAPLNTISPRPCTKVILTSWASSEVVATHKVNRGIVYLYQGKLDKAEVDFVQALKKNPQLYQAHLALAQIYYKKQQWQLSLQHYDEAISLDSSNPSVLKNRQIIANRLSEETTDYARHRP